MALLATVQVRSLRELPLMFVLVAVHALGERNLIKRVPAFRNMTLHARYARMLALQSIGAGRMLLHIELRRFESLHRVACRALDAARPPSKLTTVNVLMAIRTLLESERFFEIAALVAREAIDALVFSDEGILGFGVIEFLVYVLERNPLPAGSAVTGLAGLRKTSLMRIGMALSALAEHKADVARLVIRTRRVTLLANNLCVQSGQGKFGFVVIELRNVFPIFEVVALPAVWAQSPIMFVFVARRARLR